MRSRALPEGFDTAQALHTQYGEVQSMGRTLACDRSYSTSFEDEGIVQPLTLECLRRPESDHGILTPPSTNASFQRSLYTPPGSALVSPRLKGDTCMQSLYSPEPGPVSPVSGNPFSRSGIPPSSFRSQSYVPPLQLQENINEERAPSLAPPPKPGLPYPRESPTFNCYNDAERAPLTRPPPLGHALDRASSEYAEQRYGVPYSEGIVTLSYNIETYLIFGSASTSKLSTQSAKSGPLSPHGHST